MHREPVESSSLRDVGYDPDARVLEVGFRNGGVYRYLDVPPEEHAALLAAESRGRHLNLHVKPVYACEKVTDPRGGA